jgi:hypothetical protein
MIERNEEALSTSDLASPNEGAAASPDERATASPREAATADPTASDSPGPDGETAGETRFDPTSGERGSAPPSGETGSAPTSGETRFASAAGDTATLIDDTRERPGGDRAAGAQASDGESEANAPRADQVGSPASPAGTGDRAPASNAPLLPADLTAMFQDRWEEVQTRFVDEPRGAVEEADGLVANLMQKLAESFAQERERLEVQWGRGEDISTEDLRVALQRYRSFFQRLLAT